MEFQSFFLSLFQFFFFYLLVLLSVAFFSLLERKVLGLIHFRKGPNKVIISGMAQPFSDALKLLSKDDFPSLWSNKFTYYLGPMFMFFLASMCWMIMPSYWINFLNLFTILMIYFLLTLTVYGIMISGWASNSKYSVIGSMRAVSQSVSYEVIFSFILISVVIYFSSFSTENFMKFFPSIFSLCFLSLIMLFSILAELNRTPFDLAEGESELVSGYSIEYGGVMYTLIFLSENLFSLFSSYFFSMIFVGFYNHNLFFFMVMMILLMICIIRGVLPRMRYDSLMMVGWKKILPLIILASNLIFLLEKIL